MKKFWLLLLLFFLPTLSHAAITDEGVTREKTVTVHYSTTIAAASGASTTSSFVLVQLSSASWPHTDTGEIDISHIRVDVDKLAASTGSIKIGVVTFTNTSTGTVKFFWTRSFTKNVSNTNTSDSFNQSPAFYRCKVVPVANGTSEGTTPFILSADKRSSSGLYPSTATITCPLGLTSFLGPGDIIMEVVTQDVTNSFIVNVDLMYHSER